MLRFGVVGKIRSGKSTVAKLLGNKIGDEFGGHCKIEFSDALREVTDIVYPETKGTKDREKLIAVGQHMRKLDKDVWVNIVERKIKEVENEFGKDMPIIVSSVRQPNEVEMLERNGFVLIKVEADEDIRIQRCLNAGDSFNIESFNDYTETALDDVGFDYVIKNNEGLEHLKKCIDYIVELEKCGAEDFMKILDDIEKRMEEDN